ncbi:MFS transporter [Burkholderia multivorans]|uniref:MFS transporter n=1 Tax=Burkholderia anthina TaxID=179879 RepID=UPI00158F421F|nr:MFS transporter [Burkholderia anthina]MDN8007059.1 MFS transporter [Burkholderia multivorans]
MNSQATPLDRAVTLNTSDDRLFRRITYRLLPMLWLVYCFNYLDRTNVAYAHLQMQGDLGFSDAVFGLGASLVFLGLITFEIPSNLVLARVGLRKTLFRIMILWGMCSASMSFVTTPTAFYVLRFLVGAFEAGLVPGVLYYLTLWFPTQRRGQPCAMFYTAPSCAGIVSGPLAASFMTGLNGVAGLKGWQWLFILEGLPCIVLAFCVLCLLPDRPERASWLTPDERQRVQSLIHDADVENRTHGRQAFAAVARDPRLWVLAFTGFLMLIPQFGLTFWQPSLLKGMGLTVMQVGIWSVLPSLCGVVMSVIVAKHSDATGERCWHYIACALTAAGGLLLTTRFPSSPMMTLLCLCVAWSGFTSAYAMLWTLPGRVFSGRVAATGLAVLTVVHGSAGIVGPYGLALIKTATGGFTTSLYVGSGLLVLSTLLFYPFFSRRSSYRLRESR